MEELIAKLTEIAENLLSHFLHDTWTLISRISVGKRIICGVFHKTQVAIVNYSENRSVMSGRSLV